MVILDSKEIKNRTKIEEWVVLDGCAERDELYWARLDGRKVQVKVRYGGWFPIAKVVRNGRSG